MKELLSIRKHFSVLLVLLVLILFINTSCNDDDLTIGDLKNTEWQLEGKNERIIFSNPEIEAIEEFKGSGNWMRYIEDEDHISGAYNIEDATVKITARNNLFWVTANRSKTWIYLSLKYEKGKLIGKKRRNAWIEPNKWGKDEIEDVVFTRIK